MFHNAHSRHSICSAAPMKSSFPSAPVAPMSARPSLGEECASVLLLRRLITESSKPQVAAVISAASAEPEAATNELSRLGLIDPQNEAAVAEFIKRAVRRFG